MAIPLEYAAELDDRKFNQALGRIEGHSKRTADRMDKSFKLGVGALSGAAVFDVAQKGLDAAVKAVQTFEQELTRYGERFEFATKAVNIHVAQLGRLRDAAGRIALLGADSGVAAGLGAAAEYGVNRLSVRLFGDAAKRAMAQETEDLLRKRQETFTDAKTRLEIDLADARGEKDKAGTLAAELRYQQELRTNRAMEDSLQITQKQHDELDKLAKAARDAELAQQREQKRFGAIGVSGDIGSRLRVDDLLKGRGILERRLAFEAEKAKDRHASEIAAKRDALEQKRLEAIDRREGGGRYLRKSIEDMEWEQRRPELMRIIRQERETASPKHDKEEKLLGSAVDVLRSIDRKVGRQKAVFG